MATVLFKASQAETAKTEIRDTDFKDFYPAINRSTNWQMFKPYIQRAADEFFIPYLGQTFYDKVLADYEAGNSGAVMEKIRKGLQTASAYLAVYKGLPFMNSVISDLGVSQNGASDNSSAPVNQWRYKETRENALLTGLQALDETLEYMSANAGDAYLTAWAASENYTKNFTPWIPGPALVFESLSLKRSLRNFEALRPYILQAHDDLKRTICPDQYAALETLLKTNAVTPGSIQETIIKECRDFIAWRALERAGDMLTLSMEGGAFFVVTASDGLTERTQKNIQSQTERLKATASRLAREFRGRILNTLMENLDTFTEFKNSGYIPNPTPAVVMSKDQRGAGLIR